METLLSRLPTDTKHKETRDGRLESFIGRGLIMPEYCNLCNALVLKPAKQNPYNINWEDTEGNPIMNTEGPCSCSKLNKMYLIDLIHDAVSDLLYYDRKECETLKVGDIEELVKDKHVSIIPSATGYPVLQSNPG